MGFFARFFLLKIYWLRAAPRAKTTKLIKLLINLLGAGPTQCGFSKMLESRKTTWHPRPWRHARRNSDGTILMKNFGISPPRRRVPNPPGRRRPCCWSSLTPFLPPRFGHKIKKNPKIKSVRAQRKIKISKKTSISNPVQQATLVQKFGPRLVCFSPACTISLPPIFFFALFLFRVLPCLTYNGGRSTFMNNHIYLVVYKRR